MEVCSFCEVRIFNFGVQDNETAKDDFKYSSQVFYEEMNAATTKAAYGLPVISERSWKKPFLRGLLMPQFTGTL